MRKNEFTLTIQYKGKERYFSIEKDSFTIGRTADSDAMIKSDVVSRKHVEIWLEDNSICVKDLGSSNGTWIDGKRIPPHQKVIYETSQQLLLGGKNGPTVALKHSNAEEVTSINVANGMSILIPSPKTPPLPIPVPDEKPSNLKLVTPPRDVDPQVSKKKVAAEKNVFEQIKNLIEIESEENLRKAQHEAELVIQKAGQTADQIIQDGINTGEKKLKEFRAIVKNEEQEFERSKAEYQKIINDLAQNRQDLKNNISELDRTRIQYKKDIASQEEKIRAGEAYLKDEYARLEQEKLECESLKAQLELDTEDFRVEEKRARNRLELSVAEAQLQVTQLQGEAEKAKGQISTLSTEVKSLLDQQKYLERELSQREQELNAKTADFEKISEQVAEYKQIYHELKTEYNELQVKLDANQKLFNDLITSTETKRQESDKYLHESEASVKKLRSELEVLEKNFEAEKTRQTQQIKDSCDKIKVTHENELLVLTRQKEQIKVDIEKTSKVAQQDYDKVLAYAKTEAQNIIKDAKTKSEESTNRFEAEFALKKEQSQKALDALETKKEALKNENALQKQQNAESIEETNQIIQKMLNSSKAEAKNIFIKAEKECAAQTKLHLIDVQNKQQELTKEIASLEKVKADKLAQIEESIQSTIRNAEARAQEILFAADAQSLENKKKQEKLLAELKSVEMHSIKELRIKAEEDIINKRNERAKAAATNVYALITGEMLKARNKVLDDAFIESYTKEIKELVTDTLLDKVSADTSKLQQILKNTEDVKAKEKLFWRRLSIGGAILVVSSITLYVFPEIISHPKEIVYSAFTERKSVQSDAYIQQLEDARKKKVVELTTTEEFKSSYVDNVLYTTDYVNKQIAKPYQDKWILELNDYFIQTLDVKDTTIIKFVSLESTLIKDLVELKEKMDTDNQAMIINQMHERESQFRQKLSGIFENPDKVGRFYRFSEKFWKGHYQLKK